MTNPILKAHLEGIKMFEKEFITQHPGDSGINGSDPQEPVYEFNIDFQEPFEEAKRFKSFLSTYAENILNAAYEELSPYLEHSSDCILSYSEAGEPTANGGYRQKYKGKWYQARPTDETPKCDCGLDDCLTSFTSAIDEGIKEIKKGDV